MAQSGTRIETVTLFIAVVVQVIEMLATKPFHCDVGWWFLNKTPLSRKHKQRLLFLRDVLGNDKHHLSLGTRHNAIHGRSNPLQWLYIIILTLTVSRLR
jgi:hypothetical protein